MATTEDAVGTAEKEPNAPYIRMEITSGKTADAIRIIKVMILTLPKEEDGDEETTTEDAAALVDAADPHQEKHTINSSIEDPLSQWFRIHRQWDHHSRPGDKSPGITIPINHINRIIKVNIKAIPTCGGEAPTLRGIVIIITGRRQRALPSN